MRRSGRTAADLGDVVDCAGGLLVARRGAPTADSADQLRVGPIGDVVHPGSPPIESRRSDGVVWRRHWALPSRLVIEFVGLGSVDVAETTGVVTFDRPMDEEMEEHLLLDHVLPLVLALRGQVVLHGGVISLDDRGVLLVGASGAGKSTMTTFAWQRGWTVGGDDGAVVRAGSPPVVEPTYATVRLTTASAELLGVELSSGAPVVGKTRIADAGPDPLRTSAVPLRLVAIVEPSESAAGAAFERLRGADAHAALFGSTFHADFSADRNLPRVLKVLASVVANAVVGQLTVPRGLPGLTDAERLLRSALT